GHFRNFLIAQTADAVIALAGRHGTLSEVAMALTLGKTVVGLGTWDIDGVIPASTPEEAVRLALAAGGHGLRSNRSS
ncbi:MAG: TIGR00725 family protein, partial [Acidobacteriota bacterium]